MSRRHNRHRRRIRHQDGGRSTESPEKIVGTVQQGPQTAVEKEDETPQATASPAENSSSPEAQAEAVGEVPPQGTLSSDGAATPREMDARQEKRQEKTEDSGAGLQKALAESEAALAAEKEQHLRLIAEFDNFRKRSRREQDHIYTQAKSDLVSTFLPLLDSLDRAYQASTQVNDAFSRKDAGGIELLLRQGEACLKKLGVEEIPAAGQSFDPQFHDAIQHIEDPALGENMVTAVVQRGYRIGETIIRHAMVIVAN